MAKRNWRTVRPKNNLNNRAKILIAYARRAGMFEDRGNAPSIYILADQIIEREGLSIEGEKRVRFEAVVDWIVGRRQPAATPKKLPRHADKTTKDAFYASWEWRTVRMVVLKKYGHRCQSCGAKPLAGNEVRLTVDHIKPLSKHWELRLDPDNLQVLCDECNMGKGAWDETDYR